MVELMERAKTIDRTKVEGLKPISKKCKDENYKI